MQKRRTFSAEFFHAPLAQKAPPFDYNPGILHVSGICKTKQFQKEKEKRDDALINDPLPQGHYRNT